MIDLHIHSYFSDGTNTTDELLAIAHDKNISTISLTDHDTTLGVKEIIDKANKYDIKIIPGVEITSVSNDNLIHILGYGLDISNVQLQEFLKIISSYYTKCSLDQFTWLNSNNIIDFPVNKVIQYSSFKQSIYSSDLLKAMIENGRNFVLQDWPKFLEMTIKKYPGKFVDNFPFNSIEAVEIIKNAGGIPVFAHPARIGDVDIKEMELLLSSGLMGVETYYPYHDDKLVKKYEKFSSKNGLITTGGTDWHGEFTTWNAEIGDYGVDSLKCFGNKIMFS